MNREQIITFLSELVKFDTSINPAKNQFPGPECASFIHNHAKVHGYDILSPQSFFKGNTDIPLFPVLIVKQGKKSGVKLLFLGHIDVVPVTEAELPDWEHAPFDPVVENNLLKGRGSGDMKGGVTAFFAAFDNFKVEEGTIIIALSGDEEIGGVDTVPAMLKVLEDNNLMPDYVLNAEGAGEQVVVTKRRGGTQIKYSFDLDIATSTGTKKTRMFTSSLGDGGQSLHSMSFVLGSDTHAMITAGKFSMDKPIISISSSSVKTNAVPKEVILDYIDYNGTDEISYSKGLTKLMHALSSIGSVDLPIIKSKFGPAINPNLLDINHDSMKASVIFDIRSMVKDSAHEEIAKVIQDHFNYFDLKTDYELQLVIDPVNVSPDHPFAINTQQIAEKHGFSIMTRGEKLGGASDTRFFTSINIPGIELGPLAHNGHGTNEAVDIGSIEKLRDIYRELFVSITSK